MALLAGAKRKQKIGLDPNNINWANDSSAIGQSLLKKMGWKEGSGLGANEDGRVIPVKASAKSDTRGLGCTAQQADSWIAHQEEFDQILAALNDPTKSENSSAAASPVSVSSAESLVEKKVEGQKRFYGRFSRGRVQQLRTTEDLDCILGRRKSGANSKSKEETKPVADVGDSSPAENSTGSEDTVDKSHGFVTVISTTSVQDYFAQKLKNKKLPPSLSTRQDDREECEKDQDKEEEEQHKNSFVTSSYSVKDYFAQKMRAKNEKLAGKAASKDQGEEDDCEKENVITVNGGEIMEKVEDEVQTKKKKKKKSKCKSDVADDENSVQDTKDLSEEDKRDRKKKMKRKRSKKRSLDEDESGLDSKKAKLDDGRDVADNAAHEDDEAVSKDKGTFEDCKKENVYIEEIIDKDGNEVETKKKKKKKSKDKSGISDDISIQDADHQSEVSLEEDKGDKSIKKKKKKRKRSCNEEEICIDNKKGKLGDDCNSEMDNRDVEENESKEQESEVSDANVVNIKEDIKNTTRSSNSKKKQRYKGKQELIENLEDLLCLIDSKNCEQSLAAGCKDVSFADEVSKMLPKLNSKLVQRNTEKEMAKRQKLDTEIKELKKYIIEKATEIQNNAITALDARVFACNKRIKKKRRHFLSEVKVMSKEHNVNIDWEHYIELFESKIKSTQPVVEETKEKMKTALEKQLSDFTKRVEEMNCQTIIKFDHKPEKNKKKKGKKRKSKKNVVYPGAVNIKGYLAPE